MSLADRIASIEVLSTREKREEWRRLTKSPPPPAFGAGLLARALAYHEQEKALGGLNASDLKRIRRLSKGKSNANSIAKHEVRPGTWLSRTWHGEVHKVVVLESGCKYRGRTFGSLSAVARHITGAKSSGPRFFGLISPRIGELKIAANG